MQEYNPKKMALIIIAIFIFIGILSFLYQKNNHEETWIVCENNSEEYSNYKEIIKYRFLKKDLYGFYREEVVSSYNQEDLEDRYQYFKDIQSELDLSSDLSYEVEKKNLDVEVKTYIGVKNLPLFFDNYMQANSLKSTSTKDEIKKYYEDNKYACKVSYK